jgi:hypothetical protein
MRRFTNTTVNVLCGFCAFTAIHRLPLYGDAQPASGCPARAILGSFSTAGGDGGPAIQAQLFGPRDLARDPAGNTYIADQDNNRVRKVTPDGTITTFAGNGIAVSSGDGGPATQASLNDPIGVTADGSGNVYVSEFSGNRIRRIARDGTIST